MYTTNLFKKILNNKCNFTRLDLIRVKKSRK